MIISSFRFYAETLWNPSITPTLFPTFADVSLHSMQVATALLVSLVRRPFCV